MVSTRSFTVNPFVTADSTVDRRRWAFQLFGPRAAKGYSPVTVRNGEESSHSSDAPSSVAVHGRAGGAIGIYIHTGGRRRSCLELRLPLVPVE